jgi:hypothetical protein
MEGFDLELEHGIVLAYHGKPLYHLAEMLEQIRRDATAGRTKAAYENASGYTVRLGRKAGEPPPTAAQWLEVVSDILPVVEKIKKARKGTKALHDALVTLGKGGSGG